MSVCVQAVFVTYGHPPTTAELMVQQYHNSSMSMLRPHGTEVGRISGHMTVNVPAKTLPTLDQLWGVM